MEIILLTLGIGGLAGFSAGVYVVNRMSKHLWIAKSQHEMEKRSLVAEFRRRKDQMISDFHHKGLVPQICSIAGLVNLARRPHHHAYADLAYDQINKLLAYLRDNIVKIDEDQQKLNDAIEQLKKK